MSSDVDLEALVGPRFPNQIYFFLTQGVISPGQPLPPPPPPTPPPPSPPPLRLFATRRSHPVDLTPSISPRRSHPVDLTPSISPRRSHRLFFLSGWRGPGQVLNNLSTQRLTDSQPLMDSDLYRATLQGLFGYRAQTLSILSSRLGPFFKERPVTWAPYFQQATSLIHPVGPAPELTWAHQAPSRELLEEDKGLGPHPSPAVPIGAQPLTIEQIGATAILHAIEATGMPLPTLSSLPFFHEQTWLLFVLLRLRALTARPFALPTLPTDAQRSDAGQRCGAGPEKYAEKWKAPESAEIALVTRVCGLLPVELLPGMPWEGPVDLDALAMNCVSHAARRTLRNLLETCALSSFLGGHARAPPADCAKLPAMLPFGNEINTGMAIMMRIFLTFPLAPVSNPLPLAQLYEMINVLSKNLPACANIPHDLAIAIQFWGHAGTFVREVDPSMADVFARAAAMMDRRCGELGLTNEIHDDLLNNRLEKYNLHPRTPATPAPAPAPTAPATTTTPPPAPAPNFISHKGYHLGTSNFFWVRIFFVPVAMQDESKMNYITKLEEEMKQCQEDLQNSNEMNARLEDQVRILTEKNVKLESEAKQRQTDLRQATDLITSLEEQVRNLNETQRNTSGILTDLTQQLGTMNTLQASLKEANEELKQKVSALEAANTKLNTDKQGLMSEMLRARSDGDSNANRLAKLSLAEEQVRALTSQVGALRAQQKMMAEDLTLCKREKDQLTLESAALTQLQPADAQLVIVSLLRQHTLMLQERIADMDAEAKGLYERLGETPPAPRVPNLAARRKAADKEEAGRPTHKKAASAAAVASARLGMGPIGANLTQGAVPVPGAGASAVGAPLPAMPGVVPDQSPESQVVVLQAEVNRLQAILSQLQREKSTLQKTLNSLEQDAQSSLKALQASETRALEAEGALKVATLELNSLKDHFHVMRPGGPTSTVPLTSDEKKPKPPKSGRSSVRMAAAAVSKLFSKDAPATPGGSGVGTPASSAPSSTSGTPAPSDEHKKQGFFGLFRKGASPADGADGAAKSPAEPERDGPTPPAEPAEEPVRKAPAKKGKKAARRATIAAVTAPEEDEEDQDEAEDEERPKSRKSSATPPAATPKAEDEDQEDQEDEAPPVPRPKKGARRSTIASRPGPPPAPTPTCFHAPAAIHSASLSHCGLFFLWMTGGGWVMRPAAEEEFMDPPAVAVASAEAAATPTRRAAAGRTPKKAVKASFGDAEPAVAPAGDEEEDEPEKKSPRRRPKASA
ncbi:putative viral life cyclerelated protein [Paratrimastix pyriformis]|uniref:Viral life cyclerelated protein n=1 Tax=Paratrimastix pyriformis TaxID=342808 RepID=A0ABQ8UIS8_9EUKA|nr:putative viral life cyclerelated protein [Paratrimastix pyriformis]